MQTTEGHFPDLEKISRSPDSYPEQKILFGESPAHGSHYIYLANKRLRKPNLW